ncbi:ATP-dependent helicase [Microbacterium caowuchunii]|uniref:DNA 3'-5' helicase n=1 Tax=Microbacterium caowuchunii TaxID=2614638 RepID=A0A5J6KYQ3_9MICO|nr:ATP-dependent helicase [Microbacterium caowuchunii]KAA9134798.1 ATP-dependent helicase [Microbacterium caowuchunii]QEV99656.1 ATP-dependent helicase [Microbacterium caowuchunii]
MSEVALEGLDEHQREAVLAVRGPVCVLAGAGTGKTRVITRRIAYGVESGTYSPGRVMAVTFTAKAAGEMRGRLRALGIDGVAARTFHAAALSQLNFFWPQVAGSPAPAIVDNKVRLLAQAAETIKLSPDTATLRDIASGIEWRKVTMRSVDAFTEARPNGVGTLTALQVRDVHLAYEKLKDARHQLDFEDVLLACAGMIEAEPRVAQAVREQYRHFTVDEFQDVSPLQNRLLELWLGERRDLCVVGDASQTIYSFAGADAGHLLGFTRRYPDARQFRLERNYRSERPVLVTANALMRGRPGALQLVTERGDEAPPPSLVRYDDDAHEAAGVARRIRAQLDAGADPRQIAVLYRSHAQSAEVLAALADQGIPTSVLGGKRFFDQPEVRQAVMALRAASVAPLESGFRDSVRDVLRSLGLTDEPPPAGGALRNAWEARAALLALADEEPPGATLRSFTDKLMARAKDQHEPSLATVTLATLHAAKGLEWDHVHLIGMSEGLLPISYAQSFEAIDEERRLAYVGITRAARTLSLSWAESSGRSMRQRSRFLQEIGNRILDERSARPTSGAAPARRSSPRGSAPGARQTR